MYIYIYDCTKHDYSNIFIDLFIIYLFIYLFIYLIFSIFPIHVLREFYLLKMFLENGRMCYLVGITRTVAQQ